ncbi:hypothetical protein DH2020_033265 [Rehmannia glutinosa]|uniref:X8 domain-containing protein n=1 Tax=Rehmannia glutinosa TaxID=99300 RepID=A0ABR0VFV8_REHGL
MEFHKHLSNTLCTFIFLLITSLIPVFSDSGTIGVNYGRLANDLPPPPQVVQLLKAQGITKVKIFDTDSTVLSAFSDSGIFLTVALPNEQLSSAAADQSFTDTWIQSNILPYHPNTRIEAIAVGNEVFVDPQNTTKFLVPAMRNIHASLLKYDVASSIIVSSPLPSALQNQWRIQNSKMGCTPNDQVAPPLLQTSYPASSGSFKPDLVEPVIKPMLDFINQTGSYLMVNAYPFFAYIANSDTISLDYALFRDNNSGDVDPNNGLVYKSLFEAQTDAVFAAMAVLGFNNVKIVISETGWPSDGDENEIGANAENAAAYNGNLVRRVLSGVGTPLRPNEPLSVYLFALFNENEKPGPTSERNYGLFYPNQQKVYDIPLTAEGSEIQAAAAPPPRGGDLEYTVSKVGMTWCVANEQAGEMRLQMALDYACGKGGADCRQIMPGATCYDPNTVVAHASYAFNSYYQRNGRGSGTCDFGGAAYVVTQRPSFQ